MGNNIKYIDELLSAFSKESEIKYDENLPIEEKLKLLNICMVYRPVGYSDESILRLQDEWLNMVNSKQMIDLRRNRHEFIESKNIDDVCFYNTDVTLIVSENLFSGSSMDFSETDYVVMRGGIQINEEFYKIYNEDLHNLKYKKPYIVPGFNLYCENLAKILIPKRKVVVKEDVAGFMVAFDELIKKMKSLNLGSLMVSLKGLSGEWKDYEKNIINQTKKTIKKNKTKIKIFFIKS